MKTSVNLPAEDVEFLDEYTRSRGYGSRSAALHQAVTLLRAGELAGDYEEAFSTWQDSGEADAWEAVTADGLEW